MPTQWLRRAWLLAACVASALLLAACGGGKIESQLTPARIIAFGDAMADLGQNGAPYTVDDGGVDIWTEFVANGFGRPLEPSTSGGFSYATGNARVRLEPDAAESNATPTVKEQIDAFLNAGNKFGPDDLVLVSAGTSDVIVQAKAVMDGTLSTAEAQLNVEQAARDLAAQVRRLVAAGARHVAVAGPYNLGRSPWARQTDQGVLLERLSSASGNTGANQPRSFNERLLISMVDLGENVLYIDAALYYNLNTGDSNLNGFDNVVNPVCTSVDPGPGIGIGSGQVNSNLCTTARPETLLEGADYMRYLFADAIYPTPRGQQLFGDYALGQIRGRW